MLGLLSKVPYAITYSSTNPPPPYYKTQYSVCVWGSQYYCHDLGDIRTTVKRLCYLYMYLWYVILYAQHWTATSSTQYCTVSQHLKRLLVRLCTGIYNDTYNKERRTLTWLLWASCGPPQRFLLRLVWNGNENRLKVLNRRRWKFTRGIRTGAYASRMIEGLYYSTGIRRTYS